jgi:hypothetical protein
MIGGSDDLHMRMKLNKESLWSTRPTDTFYSRIFKRYKAPDTSCLMKISPLSLYFSPVASYHPSKSPICLLPLADFFELFILGPSFLSSNLERNLKREKPVFVKREI